MESLRDNFALEKRKVILDAYNKLVVRRSRYQLKPVNEQILNFQALGRTLRVR